MRRGFEKPFADLLREGVPFYAALGNHDYEPGVKEFELRYAAFHMEGRRYYSQSFGGGLVETFMLDSNTLQGKNPNLDAQQIAWLERSLAESKAVWKVVVLHHPLYSTAMKYPSDPNMIEVLEPIFRQNGVSIVLQGHNHLYERLAPIHGVTYITAGSAGTVSKGNLRANVPERIAGDDTTEVFVMLEFDRTTCHLTAYNGLGSLIDDGTVSVGLGANSPGLSESAAERGGP
jgi:3',5'-cyclic AMP phosphodiesterase CpdA